jgi:SanA protein
MNHIPRMTTFLLWVAILPLLIFFSINLMVSFASSGDIYTEIRDIPKAEVGLVLGASVKPNKEMSDVFKDRVDVAIDMYEEGKIEKVLVSGDSKEVYYDEVGAAEKYLLSAGIPGDDIILDKEGYDTYDSLFRARYVFGVEELVIITQEFHLPRAIYIAKALGMKPYGARADLHHYVMEERMVYREKFANLKAILDVATNKEWQRIGR